ncbi:3-oxo-tetronate kinase [Microbacterium alcoholitolerans]|uniref:3-oxo-tetronate kinase n=1 Tax=unclassified Microbacterium TaxID=2609290 RepID=UPI003D17D8A9
MIGVIADDVTGATDVAAALSRAGLRTVLVLDAGAPLVADAADADAVVIGLKTRSIAPHDAVSQSLAALDALELAGAERFYLKYCSTFDSTAEGNIGPVTEALAERLNERLIVTTPASPLHGRTVYQGHLFVGSDPLHETHMRHHPITPMHDSSVPRLLGPQVGGTIDVLSLQTVHRGASAVDARIREAAEAGVRHLIADAVAEGDLDSIAAALHDAVLVAGSAGLIGALARRIPASGRPLSTPGEGRTALIAGSCSRRTLEQIDRFQKAGGESFPLVADDQSTAEGLAADALAWWDRLPDGSSALIYSSQPAEERAAGMPGVGALYEETAGLVARGLAERGLRRMLIAGGETSGQVVKALGTHTAVVGEEVATGVPWIHDTRQDLHLALKSGNFGGPDLFVDVALAGGER